MATHRKVKPGYRLFQCEECGKMWKSATRDALSPSGEHCIDDDCFVMSSPANHVFVDLPIDKHGNLRDDVDQNPIEISSLETVK